MLRSMFAGVSGLRTHQIKMDVIGNNIANVNTQGFKGSRATFKEMYNQTLRTPTAPSGALGGINPMQIGLGVTTGSIDVVFSNGGIQTTDRALDIAIEGEGFFIVSQGENDYYTRSGNFYLDSNGFVVTSNGLFVKGVNLLDESYYDPELNTIMEGVNFNIQAEDYEAPEYEINAEDDCGRLLIPLNFSNIAIAKDGLITGISPEGELMTIGAIPLVSFVAPPGLDRIGDNLYRVSNNSGVPVYHRAGYGEGAGDLKSGALEMSNVDLSREFTDMIITQRGYQANSRIITVSDTLLEELINLKR